MINEEIKKNYSMKILFGPMFGCELHLPANDYFLIINPALALLDKNIELEPEHEHAACYATNTLYIPCDLASPNISLRLSESFIDDGYTYFDIEIHDENGCNYKTSFRKNDVFTHEYIKLAVKCSDEEWSDEIKNYHTLLPAIEINSEDGQKSTNKKRRLVGFLLTLVIITTLFFLTIFGYYKISTDQQVISLSEALSGAPTPLEIVKGRESKKIYILAHKSREMEWAKEAIYKMKDRDNLILVLLSQRKIDIIGELFHLGYPVLQLNYSSSNESFLSVYRSLTANEEVNLKKLILQKMPYAESVNFIIKTKEQLIRDARQGLDRLNIPYRMINTATGYSLVIRDALSDNSLNSLHDFIKEFNQQWGNTVITFSINLDENWLQNKSYVDSAKGYLFLNPRHWYFPLNNKEL